MQLQTLVPIPQLQNPISYQAQVVSLGSCFAVHMADKLSFYQFQNKVNPLGILFHPLALEKLLRFAKEGKIFNSEDVFLHQELWSCFDAHSQLNALQQSTLITQLNTAVTQLTTQLSQASHLIITLGTAWVYRDIETGEVVANCHKLPQKRFNKELLSVAEITASLERMQQYIAHLQPKIQVIYTLSPVRHIKDGFVENQQSKAHLIAGLHEFLQTTNQFSYYFPAYELLMDELRDYRFYALDLVHPNTLAIDYIWEKFVEKCVTLESQTIMKNVGQVQQGLRHRPLHPRTAAHELFVQQLNEKKAQLTLNYPFMNFETYE